MVKQLLFFLLLISSAIASPVLVFDFDGVMTNDPDPAPIYSFLHETLHLTRSEFDEIYPQIQSGQTDKEFWQKLAMRKHVPITQSWGSHFKTVVKNSFVNEEMFGLVEQLKRQNQSVVLFSNMNEQQAMQFQNMGLFTLFEPRIFTYEMGTAKPDPKAYAMLLDQLNLSAEDIVFIDDRPENISAAQKMGIDAILFQSADQICQALLTRGILHQ